MKRARALSTLLLLPVLALGACSQSADEPSEPENTTSESSGHEGHDMQHPEDGGPPPEGIAEAAEPTYPVGAEVVLAADHMPGMEGAPATVSGAFDTTAYAVSYTPTTGGEPVTGHRWVVHEELADPGQAPLEDGTEVVLEAEHMSGMKGAEATIDYSTEETVYMVDIDTEEMTMTNHKWVTESELRPAE
ncbi:YdhK family protein [Corynebacterium halotolerans]|uniref:YdhK family protein n=1 Tax=Corynebacterium halotolerans TaxID=225326 RepID=UPI003CE7A4C2